MKSNHRIAEYNSSIASIRATTLQSTECRQTSAQHEDNVRAGVAAAVPTNSNNAGERNAPACHPSADTDAPSPPSRQVAGRIVQIVAALCSAMVSCALLGNGIAHAGSAPDVRGQKYSDASAALSSTGYRPVVTTAVGDRKAWPDCIVASQTQRKVQAPPNSASNGGVPVNEVMVALNCYGATATFKSPGFSAASPEGKTIASKQPSPNAQTGG
jgi:hypothetical protein